MLGNPIYKKGDKVSFNIDNITINGEIYIVDRFGVFEDNTDVYYDILGKGDPKYISDTNPEGECLYKHIKETLINN